ncbi:hypothetical protein [Burkholderia gladioli]|uniref:hypothetical protein n=1 Tax=Burkholderia gladioli TaxID=28095 RepID=UPI0016421FF4|nr:hypothetical protein [Burkholderia gladioli]
MGNWFEKNATSSIVLYTIVVAGATWGASTFILQDDRLNLAHSELETQKSLTESYKAKAELLQHDVETLRAENREYENWLGQTKDAIPVIVPHITELNDKITRLEAEARTRAASSPVADASRAVSARLGSAFIDDVTGLVFTVRKTNPNQTADISIKLPGTETPMEASINAGQQWHFTWKNTKYLLTATDISFITDTVELRISKEQ